MTSIRDVQPNALIKQVSIKMKEIPELAQPEWSAWVKTGPHAERKPEDPDWWYMRCASVLRRVAINGPIGVGKLRNWYGGKKNRGVKPEKHVAAGGKIIRTVLQQLETANFIEKDKDGGRRITKKGQSLLDKSSAEVAPRVEKKKKVEKPKKTAKKETKSKKEEAPVEVKEDKPKEVKAEAKHKEIEAKPTVEEKPPEAEAAEELSK